ncbi:FHA domain-containing protein [Paludisphaera rhizosphaerae]|nr:FHA domain-containing protein [Paludisphaera rhizosphaerae]
MKTSLIVGSRPECDVVVTVPSVSGRHCQAIREGDVVYLQDLDSRNGTYVNGNRLAGADRVAITASDIVHLASHQLDLAPVFADLSMTAASTERYLSLKGDSAVVGRGIDCDITVALPNVSTRHARLARVGGEVMVEDLGSANGTFIDDVPVKKPTVIPRQGVLSLGSSRFRLTQDSWGSLPLVIASQPTSGVLGTVPPTVAPSLSVKAAETSAIGQSKMAILAAGIAAAPMLAGLGARLADGGGFTAPFILALAAPALGALDVLALSQMGVSGPWALAGVVGSIVVQAALLGVLGAPSALPSALIILALAGFVGAAAAALIKSCVPVGTGPQAAATIGLVAAMASLGGLVPMLPDLPAILRPAAALSPTRWAFEGLVLADSAAKPVAERIFPAATHQMGMPADCAALTLMATGLVGLIAALRNTNGVGPQPAFSAA